MFRLLGAFESTIAQSAGVTRGSIYLDLAKEMDARVKPVHDHHEDQSIGTRLNDPIPKREGQQIWDCSNNFDRYSVRRWCEISRLNRARGHVHE
jgi:hypothetical protein